MLGGGGGGVCGPLPDSGNSVAGGGGGGGVGVGGTILSLGILILRASRGGLPVSPLPDCCSFSFVIVILRPPPLLGCSLLLPFSSLDASRRSFSRLSDFSFRELSDLELEDFRSCLLMPLRSTFLSDTSGVGATSGGLSEAGGASTALPAAWWAAASESLSEAWLLPSEDLSPPPCLPGDECLFFERSEELCLCLCRSLRSFRSDFSFSFAVGAVTSGLTSGLATAGGGCGTGRGGVFGSGGGGGGAL